MNAEEIWKSIPQRQRMMLYVNQVEWAIFQATLIDIAVDAHSLQAVIEAKRSVAEWKRTKNLNKAMNEANGVFKTDGGFGKIDSQKTLSKLVLASMCYSLAYDVNYDIGVINKAYYIDYTYAFYLNHLGDLKHKSPLARWLMANGIYRFSNNKIGVEHTNLVGRVEA